MSRTFKDKPYRIKHPGYDTYTERIEYIETYLSVWTGKHEEFKGYWYKEVPGIKTKKRREVDTEDHWMTTPSAWTRLMMNRPARRAAHLQEVAALKTLDLEDIDFPDVGHKPHQYYW